MADPSSFAYGGRARLGLIVPTTNTVNEPEWWSLLPAGVTAHVARMPLHLAGHDAGADLPEPLAIAIDALKPARLSTLLYACTAGSLVLPPTRLSEAIAARAGIPALTTALALVLALRAVGARRIAVATPYGPTLNGHERHFLTGMGFSGAAVAGLGHGEGGPHEFPRIAATPLAAVAAHIRVVARAAGSIDAMLVSCTDFPTLPLIPALEAEFGVPVISSNSAGLWASLRLAGIADAIPRAGRLFAESRLPPLASVAAEAAAFA